MATALSVAILSDSKLGRAVGDGVSSSIESVKTVAAMLAERSPGERPDGALVNLKPKRQSALHERALPKVRGPAAIPYEALVAAPPNPVIAPPPKAPLYNVVAGGPPVVIAPTTGVVPGTPGGPPVLTDIPLPGGGGGGIFSPPVVAAAPDTPPIPVTPVPEPAAWAMMLVGLALIGRVLRKDAAVLRRAIG
ncbi:MAG: PEPxxWA-CTERM sorting domain-containing protein [Sphingomonas sp.]